MSEISDRLLAAITEKGYSYGELSRLTGIPKSAIQRYATGQTEKIPIDRLELLASALSVSSRYLMGWEDPDQTPEAEQDTSARARFLRAFDQLDPAVQELLAAQAEAALALRQSQDTH